MKKIPTLFEREFSHDRVVKTLNQVTPGMEWVLNGEGIATVKIDGSCCAIINGELYKRCDCKKGKVPPDGFLPCCEPDKITGHWPGWVKCDREKPEDNWFWNAYDISSNLYGPLNDETYEAIGPHFNGNPYNLEKDCLEKHGKVVIQIKRDFDSIREYLRDNYIEGIVFWRDGEPQCKIKRSDFGFDWNKH